VDMKYAMKRGQEYQEGLELDHVYEVLVYNCVNLPAENYSTREHKFSCRQQGN
jgi:hypothetical protein